MLLIGIVAGILLAKPLLPGAQRARRLEKELEEAKAEQARYRQQVTEHFEKTGELFQEMAQGYRTVYDHLARGAHELCREGTQTPQLDLPDKRLLSGSANPNSEGPPSQNSEAMERADLAPAPDNQERAPSGAQGQQGEAKEIGDTSPPRTDAAAAEQERKPAREPPTPRTAPTPSDEPDEAATREEAAEQRTAEAPETASTQDTKEQRPAVH
jgi:uncharacterized membrane-anchored protein YhcB (DUF1043 family)